MTTRVIITKHAYDRARERMSIGHQALDRLVETAYLHGVRHTDTRGRMNRYLDKLYLEHRTSNNIRLYGEYVFFFCNQTLITLYQLPNDLRRYVKVFKKRP